MHAALNEGLQHHQSGRLAEAEQCYRRVLIDEPNNADALHLLGVIAYQVKRPGVAVELIERAIAINPSAAMYFNNLGNALRDMGERDRAAAAFERAIALQPDYAEAHANLGSARRDQARFADAVSCYQRALALNPSLAPARADLATVLKDQGRVEESIAEYERATKPPNHIPTAHSHLLYAMHASNRFSPLELFEAHKQWGARYAAVLPAKPPARPRDGDRRLRVGYVSPDFRDHPVARFLQPILRHRDRDAFEVVCYSDVARRDETTAALRGLSDEWHDLAALSDAEAAELIRQHKIDILVDLAGHTGQNRLLMFARKPAPVQITYLGYPDTTGMSAMDYRITDAIADPPGEADTRHTEKLIRLDGCFLAYTLLDELPPVSPTVWNGHVTFGSFNNLSKISPRTIRLWANTLDGLPRSRMLIKATSLGDQATRDLAAERFAQWGLPMDRVELVGPARSQAEHLQTYARIDVALDTFPYNGTTTTCEALAMGVPVVSLYGTHHASRVGFSILSAAGFAGWATDDSAHFVRIARQVAGEAAGWRSHLREQIRTSTLCDGRGIAGKIESAYRSAWRAYVGKAF
jgi:protein O-GlcNAc transferase